MFRFFGLVWIGLWVGCPQQTVLPIFPSVDSGTVPYTSLEGPSPIPPGAVLFFQLKSCPAGFSRLAILEGRTVVGLVQGGTLNATVGDSLDNEGSSSIIEVPAHTHAVFGQTVTTNNAGQHSHEVDPPTVATTAAGAHDHDLRTGGGIVGGGGGTTRVPTQLSDDTTTSSAPVENSAAHSHAVDFDPFDSENAGGHNHSIDIPENSTRSAGVPSVDVTMPYVQLLPCVKQ